MELVCLAVNVSVVLGRAGGSKSSNKLTLPACGGACTGGGIPLVGAADCF